MHLLEMLIDGVYKGYGSKFVLFELFGSLSKIDPLAAVEASNAYLSMPIEMLELKREMLQTASEIALRSKTTYDAIHAALMMHYNVNTIITEDLDDWIKIKNIWRSVADDLGFPTDNLIIISPTQGKVN